MPALRIDHEDLVHALEAGDDIDVLRKQLLRAGHSAQDAEDALDEAVEHITHRMATDPDAAAMFHAMAHEPPRPRNAHATAAIGAAMVAAGMGIAVYAYNSGRPVGYYLVPSAVLGIGVVAFASGIYHWFRQR